MFDKDDLDTDAGPSKTEVKRQMHALQDLATALLELPEEMFEQIEMEVPLRDALQELRRMKTREGRRRQAQYVGKLVRLADPAPMHAALEAYRLGKLRAEANTRQAEVWRQRLLEDDQAVTDWVQAHPGGDISRFRTLVRNARRESAAVTAAPPGGAPARKGKAYRELFQVLRSTLDARAAAAAAPSR